MNPAFQLFVLQRPWFLHCFVYKEEVGVREVVRERRAEGCTARTRVKVSGLNHATFHQVRQNNTSTSVFLRFGFSVSYMQIMKACHPLSILKTMIWNGEAMVNS